MTKIIIDNEDCYFDNLKDFLINIGGQKGDKVELKVETYYNIMERLTLLEDKVAKLIVTK